ncbi:hypothetical protein M514_09755 [Trichuris suis]|uniref:Uncharacterized protein n=1 Tax=Trichuris suis TaxID=68888 RepID=A0A085N4Z5_9BILA|nr:hypothetical protein M513_09755 [Trichuris suis]KFD64541.1 hypothetical protein M514_09755 [Trichuris suis]
MKTAAAALSATIESRWNFSRATSAQRVAHIESLPTFEMVSFDQTFRNVAFRSLPIRNRSVNGIQLRWQKNNKSAYVSSLLSPPL